MTRSKPPHATVVVVPVEMPVPVSAAVSSFAQAREPALLESTSSSRPGGRFSIFACDPWDEMEVFPSAIRCPFQALAARVNRYPRVADPPPEIPFAGGWIGFFAYEAGLAVERIASGKPRRLPVPLARFRLYDSAAIYDHVAAQWSLAAVDWPAAWRHRRPPAEARLATLKRRLASALDPDPKTTDPPAPRSRSATPSPDFSYRAYLAKVRRVQRYIAAGDVYQVNLTQRFTTRTDRSPLALYRRLRRVNPSSHAALLLWKDSAILSSSPELFLQLRNGHVVTRPIKGTRPRTGLPQADAVYRRELATSPKERAELNMIIDLLRNDLGRVCRFGSVRVLHDGKIEAHPTVYHRVATIEGRLDPRHGWRDLLTATFPGGSVTGAPKIRAMQIIDELEPTPRGVYCGAIGHVGLDGSMTLNLGIRTMLQIGALVHVHAGGAIVADSLPEAEYEELIAKASGMLRALECGPPAKTPRRMEVTAS